MKVFFRNIHLYLSLAAGLVIMSCCFTGAILVFEKELLEGFNHDRYYVKQDITRIPIEQLIAKVKQKFPAAKIASVKIYPDPERSVEVGVSIPEKGNEAQGRSKPKIEQTVGKEKEGALAGIKPAAGQK